jgi:hypothetical protein
MGNKFVIEKIMDDYYGEAAPTNGDEAYGSEPETMETSTEEFMENERLDTSWYIYEYYAWGLVHVAMIIIGAYINNWYYWLVTGNSWFIIQCPLIEYTKVTADDTTPAQVARFTGSATKTAVGDNGWNRARCLDAAPVYQWTTEAYWILIWYSFGFFLWMLNTAFGQHG